MKRRVIRYGGSEAPTWYLLECGHWYTNGIGSGSKVSEALPRGEDGWLVASCRICPEVDPERWMPPDELRVNIAVHPDVRKALHSFLVDECAGSGVGYSEFVMGAVQRARALRGLSIST